MDSNFPHKHRKRVITSSFHRVIMILKLSPYSIHNNLLLLIRLSLYTIIPYNFNFQNNYTNRFTVKFVYLHHTCVFTLWNCVFNTSVFVPAHCVYKMIISDSDPDTHRNLKCLRLVEFHYHRGTDFINTALAPTYNFHV